MTTSSSSSGSQHMDFDAKVEYWSSEQQQHHHHHHHHQQQQGHQNRFKCSQMEVHPSKPLVLSVDLRDGSLCLWDIQLKRALLDAVSVYTLFADSLKSSSSRHPPPAAAAPMLRPSPIHHLQQPQPKTQRNDDDDPMNIYRRKTTVKPVHVTRGSEAASTSSSSTSSNAGAIKAKQYMGNVIQFGFADLSSVLHANGFNNNSSSSRDLAAWQHLHCSDSLIFLVCEHVVLLYDYFTKQTPLCVTMSDSMRKQMVSSSSSSTMASAATQQLPNVPLPLPTSAEQIYFNTCAVSGADGSIRLWDLSRMRTSAGGAASITPIPMPMTISFQTFSKSSIVAIKSVPKKRYSTLYCMYCM